MDRKALGKGLASLIPTTLKLQPEISESAQTSVPIDSIISNPDQPRKSFDESKIEELAQSIREKGILLPLLVTRKGDRYELLSGERRLRAATQAGLSEVPVIIREVTSEERLEIALIENIQRDDLNPIEEAFAYQTLIDRFNYTQEQVAAKVGKNRTTVANLLRLLKLPTKIRQALESGALSMGHARALLGVPEMERQLYLSQKVVEEGWSVHELEAKIAAKRLFGVGGKVKNLKPLPPQIVQILDDMRRALGTQIRVIPSSQRKGKGISSQGKILIDYYSEDDLDRIYKIVTHQ